jgi:hypothetical protein
MLPRELVLNGLGSLDRRWIRSLRLVWSADLVIQSENAIWKIYQVPGKVY